ncbi:antitoxin [Mycolicibacterium frederiksbergense]|uniref:antitoxin n=1 Tax=Mycolicibacterium frederiksbergense TaxID=117567 RepID=UPI0021F260B8|nr:antitoxin [Mycolicibacterium frederiksbergense]
MKLGVSLSDEDVAVLDAYVKNAQLPSRSAGLQRAVQLLRYPDLEDDYARAWNEWTAAEERGGWNSTAADGTSR